MLKILKYAKSYKLIQICKNMQHKFLYLDCMYYETNLYQIRFLICSFLRIMQMHKVSEP